MRIECRWFYGRVWRYVNKSSESMLLRANKQEATGTIMTERKGADNAKGERLQHL